MMHSRALRVLISLVAVGACSWAMWASARTGFSRVLVKYGMSVASADAFDNAVSLTPADAEAHDARAQLSSYLDKPDAALKDLELAVSLRPRDYGLWLELGLTRDQLEDTAGALAAFNESVRLAPYYSKPRWQSGN
jgi:Flp pilus assembly protein TadD